MSQTTTKREKAALMIFTAVVTAMVIWAFGPLRLQPQTFGVVGFGLGVGFAMLVLFGGDPDVWDRQDDIMRRSDQLRPNRAELNTGTLLYVALIFEELAETLRAMKDPMERWPTGAHSSTYAALKVHGTLRMAAHDLEEHSKAIKDAVPALMPASGVLLREEEAEPIADGLTDLSVVVAGATISSGLPGRALYDEVQDSNLSKANPTTGIIDKEPTGKWIKGVNYRPADIRVVLRKTGSIRASARIDHPARIELL